MYLENNLIIPNDKIILIIDYIHFKNEENRLFSENEMRNKKLINLAFKNEKSVVITDKEVYFTSYGTQTLMTRGNEFFKIVGGMK